MRVCLGVLVVSAHRRGLLNYQCLPCYIFTVLLKRSTQTGQHSEVSELEWKIYKKSKKTKQKKKTAQVTVCDIVFM